MRVAKKYDERYKEILDTSEQLFTQIGYENTTVNNILEAVNIGKGTLYHYIASKEDLADGIINRIIRYITANVKAAVDDSEADAHVKMRKAIVALSVTESPYLQIFGALGLPSNALLHQKFTVAAIREIAPLLASIVKQGVEEGIYHTAYPQETIEIILAANQIIYNWTVMQFSQEERIPRMAAFRRMIELGLGAKEGSFTFLDEVYAPLKITAACKEDEKHD